MESDGNANASVDYYNYYDYYEGEWVLLLSLVLIEIHYFILSDYGCYDYGYGYYYDDSYPSDAPMSS